MSGRDQELDEGLIARLGRIQLGWVQMQSSRADMMSFFSPDASLGFETSNPGMHAHHAAKLKGLSAASSQLYVLWFELGSKHAAGLTAVATRARKVLPSAPLSR